MGAGGAVDTRATHRDLGPVIARRLRVDPWLVGQHIGIAGGATVFDAGHIDQVAGAGHFIECVLGGFQFAAFFAAYLHLTQFQGTAVGGGGTEECQR